MFRAQIHTFWIGLVLISLALVGFRCGTLAQDCLGDTDCSAQQRCVVFRCLAHADERIPELFERHNEEAGDADASELSEHHNEGGGDADASEQMPRCRLGDWCEDGLLYENGLTCHQGRCMTPCDPQVSVRSNPACAPEGTISVCFALTPNTGICKDLCSARKPSAYADPNCKLGTYCVDQSGIYEPGVCTPTTPPARGTRLLGQTCAKIPKEDDCNGDQQLVCALSGATQRCLLACDPRQTGGCPAGNLCQGTNLSFLGGVCQSL